MDANASTPSVNTSNSAATYYDPSKDPKRRAKSKDPGWKYGYWPNLEDKNIVRCTLCTKEVNQGIKRLKQHLVGGYGDVTKCANTTPAIAREMHDYIMGNKRRRPLDDFVEELQVPPPIDDLDALDASLGRPQTQSSGASTQTFPSSGTAAKKNPVAKGKGTMDAYVMKKPEDVVAERRAKGHYQTTIENRIKGKEERKNTCLYIARWMYERAIPFNAINCRSFEEMIEAIGQFGPGLKPPTYHEVRVPLLNEVKNETENTRKGYEEDWKVYGCTLMSDGWTDQRGRHLINFLVNSPGGTYFLGSVDASSEIQDADMLFKLLDGKIEQIGENKVVQVVTDNAANYKAAGRLLMEKRTSLYWTPCAAHCLDLMLEDIGKLKAYKVVITKARRITSFIYRHTRLLEAMRRKTEGKDLVRAAITRFATSFMTLSSLWKHKDALRQLFVSDDWKNSNLSGTEAGMQVAETVLAITFWNGVGDCLRASQPLLVVLRVVDGDERPAMAEVYMAMEEAKNKIKFNFSDKERLWKKIINIVDRRWECQMDRPLYAAAFFLNPDKYYQYSARVDVTIQDLCKIYKAFNDVIGKMVHDGNLQDKIMAQSEMYKASEGMFSTAMAIRQRDTASPILWWKTNGVSTPELLQVALRIVGLCCSSSGCEHNWSTFNQNHTKRRNRLEHQRLNDVVYIQYNRRLKARFTERREKGQNHDPLQLDELDWTSEWMTGQPDEELVHDGDDLLWRHVDTAVGASTSHEGGNRSRRVGVCYTRNTSRSRVRDTVEENSDEGELLEGEDFNDDLDIDDDFGHRTQADSTGQQQREHLSADFIDDYD